MLVLGQLGSSCPVNWKQSSFVDLGLLISNNDYQVHIDDYMFNKDVLLMIIGTLSNWTPPPRECGDLDELRSLSPGNGHGW